MQLITKSISLDELKVMSIKMFGNLVKAVVDLEKEIMVIDALMHADEENLLLKSGSNLEDVWGVSLHLEKYGTDDFIEFFALMNIRLGNYVCGVESVETQYKIRKVVAKLVTS